MNKLSIEYEDIFKNIVKTINRKEYNEVELYQLLTEIFTSKELEIITQFTEVKSSLFAAEWNWNQQSFLLDQENKKEVRIDLTYMGVGYFKAIELFLYEKIKLLANGRFIKKNVRIGSNKYDRTTLGDYYRFIGDCGEIILKTSADKKNVYNYVKNWTDKIRNSFLHKTILDDQDKAMEVREESIKVLKKLIKDLR